MRQEVVGGRDQLSSMVGQVQRLVQQAGLGGQPLGQRVGQLEEQLCNLGITEYDSD